MDDSKGIAIAFEEAKLSYSEGGIPVGTCLPTYLAYHPPITTTTHYRAS